MMRAFPLILIAVIAYNVLVFGGATTGHDMAGLLGQNFPLTVMSGDVWRITLGDGLVALALVLLFIETVKAARTSPREMLNHALSLVTFIVALVEFITLKGFGTSVFFLIAVCFKVVTQHPSVLRGGPGVGKNKKPVDGLASLLNSIRVSQFAPPLIRGQPKFRRKIQANRKDPVGSAKKRRRSRQVASSATQILVVVRLLQFLKNKGVDTRTFFCPMTQQPFLRQIQGYRETKTPVADGLWDNGFYLPSSPTLSEEKVRFIAEQIKSGLAEQRR